MRIIFLHPNMPAQFKFTAAEMAKDPNNDVLFLSRTNLQTKIPGVRVIPFKEKTEVPKDLLTFAHKYIEGANRATAVAQILYQLKKQNWIPDIIVSHSGWGDGFYFKAIFPEVPLLNFQEFYFHPHGTDLDFLKQSEVSPDDIARTVSNNSIHMVNHFNADWTITPTYWQRSVHPPEMWDKMSVLHEGFDTEKVVPKKLNTLMLPDGTKFTPGVDEIITHVERNLEPHRGFDVFMKSVEIIQKRRKNAHFVVIGGDNISYGGKLSSGKSYREHYLEKFEIDESRIHFLGYQKYENYIKVLQASSCHIYLTVPFVLSWSFNEAMAAGCCMIASNTPPVKEIMTDGVEGLLVDFFNSEQIADKVDYVFENPEEVEQLRKNARAKIVEQYNIKDIIKMHKQLIIDLANRKVPPPAHKTIMDWNRKWGREDKKWQDSFCFKHLTLSERDAKNQSNKA